jgi:hypothetical protein
MKPQHSAANNNDMVDLCLCLFEPSISAANNKAPLDNLWPDPKLQ